MRSAVFRMRLLEDEKVELFQKASEAQLNVSDYIRRETGLKVRLPPPARPRRLLQHFEREAAKHDAEPGLAGLDGLRRRIKR